MNNIQHSPHAFAQLQYPGGNGSCFDVRPALGGLPLESLVVHEQCARSIPESDPVGEEEPVLVYRFDGGSGRGDVRVDIRVREGVQALHSTLLSSLNSCSPPWREILGCCCVVAVVAVADKGRGYRGYRGYHSGALWGPAEERVDAGERAPQTM